MAKYPWPAGGDTTSLKCGKEEEAQVDEWEGLQTEVGLLRSPAQVISPSLLP